MLRRGFIGSKRAAQCRLARITAISVLIPSSNLVATSGCPCAPEKTADANAGQHTVKVLDDRLTAPHEEGTEW